MIKGNQKHDTVVILYTSPASLSEENALNYLGAQSILLLFSCIAQFLLFEERGSSS